MSEGEPATPDWEQLDFDFNREAASPSPHVHDSARSAAPEPQEGALGDNELPEPASETASALTRRCQQWLHELGLPGAAKLVSVIWNARLRSTAGYASYPAWRVELNPRLREYPGQVDRTLRHELAHLIAYHRAGRKRIEPHGAEWREACAALGIPDEHACHQLPLPRSRQQRKLVYRCAACGFTLHRVRRFRRPTACRSCCDKHSSGAYDARFRFELVDRNGSAGD